MDRQVVALKDYGWNTNVTYKRFVRKHCRCLNIRKNHSVINHSDRESTEFSSEIVMDAEIELGDHKYSFNCVVANFWYDILFGISWESNNIPQADHKKDIVTVYDINLLRRPTIESKILLAKLQSRNSDFFSKRKRSSIRTSQFFSSPTYPRIWNPALEIMNFHQKIPR